VSFVDSGIYLGNVRHRRFVPKQHAFNYPMYMLAFDLDELKSHQSSWLLGVNRKALLQFNTRDYFEDANDLDELKQRIHSKVNELQGNWDGGKVIMLTQVRCLGLYFSPVNFYYCYQDNLCKYLLAEVSNTPWNEKHYYLVPFETGASDLTPKSFHVSPFMKMNMGYKWKVTPPGNSVSMHIENIGTEENSDEFGEKVFDATFAFKKQPMSKTNLRKLLLRFPAMTLSIVSKIYWQAFKMYVLKGFKYIPHPNSRG
jgi:hypothetical protein